MWREVLLWLAPAGLVLDIIGFLLVILLGHTLFVLSGGLVVSQEKDGSVGFRILKKWQQNIAWVGVALVMVGFILQGIGSSAAILWPSQ